MIKNGIYKKKILIIQTRPGIGDMCVFYPPIREISQKFENYDLHLLTKKRSHAKDFLKNEKFIKKIIYIPKYGAIKLNYSLFKILKKENYNKCFIMHYGLRYFFLALLAKIKIIFFYGLFKKNENIVKKSRDATCNWLGYKKLNFKSNINFKIKKIKKNQITIGIGGSGDNKKWHINNYIQLIKMIIKKNPNIKILLAGGRNEIKDEKKIIKAINIKPKNINSLCNLNIKEAIKHLYQSKLYLGNDTGFMHLSGCMGIKSYGLFGTTSTNYSSYNKMIYPITSKRVKMHSGSSKMDNIKIEYVFKKIIKHL